MQFDEETFNKNLNEIPQSILYIKNILEVCESQLKIIFPSIIFATSLQKAWNAVINNNSPVTISLSNVSVWVNSLSKRFKTGCILKIPSIEPENGTLYKVFPVPELNSRTDLHHYIVVNNKYIASDGDSLRYMSFQDISNRKDLNFYT